jgi:assimilatory nitrate reductase electron transfer subunit
VNRIPAAVTAPAGRPERVVVVGLGMAAGRLVDEVVARQDDGRARNRIRLTVLGAEPYGAYNRVLLTEVLAGHADVAALGTGDPHGYADRGVDVRVGRAVAALALPPRGVSLLLDDGSCVGGDRVVLATGAEPVAPRLDGLSPGRWPAGVHTFRTLDDCRELVAATTTARRAVVVGGGLLGLESARGLAGRGLAVTVLHSGTHLLERQLDAEAAAVLSLRLGRLGIDPRPGSRIRGVESAAGRLAAVVLDDGQRLPTDLLVLACGVRARTDLAAGAGIDTGRGVRVDDTLTSSDPRVLAIGDCAEHHGSTGGLVAPAWEQARVVADLLTGADRDARYRGRRAPVRLKAADVDVAAAGEAQTDLWDTDRHVVRLADPGRGRYLKVVVREGRVVGALTVGDPAAAAELTLMVDRATPAPRDPALLLLPRAYRATPADDPTLVPDRATICRCNGVTKGDLVRAWSAGARTVPEVSRRTRAGTGCGGCADAVTGLLDWLGTTDPDPAPGAVPDPQTPARRRPPARSQLSPTAGGS